MILDNNCEIYRIDLIEDKPIDDAVNNFPSRISHLGRSALVCNRFYKYIIFSMRSVCV
jgi:hypothetical protein